MDGTSANYDPAGTNAYNKGIVLGINAPLSPRITWWTDTPYWGATESLRVEMENIKNDITKCEDYERIVAEVKTLIERAKNEINSASSSFYGGGYTDGFIYNGRTLKTEGEELNNIYTDVETIEKSIQDKKKSLQDDYMKKKEEYNNKVFEHNEYVISLVKNIRSESPYVSGETIARNQSIVEAWQGAGRSGHPSDASVGALVF